MLGTGFRLLETMKVDNGRVALLHRHLERLSASARHFGFVCHADAVRDSIVVTAGELVEPRVIRLLLSTSGEVEIQITMPPLAGRPSALRMSKQMVHSGDPMLYHKTTAREFYARARAGSPEDMDVLLTNERGEITETTIANIAVWREGSWITPAVSCGLLPGTMRAQLLAEGEIVEGIVGVGDLLEGETIRYFNAVRGVMEVPFMNETMKTRSIPCASPRLR